MSEYIRRVEDGVCFTCGDKRHWKLQNAGHYIHKDCLDYDDINIHCQCVRCNKWLRGNLGVYAEKLIDKHGKEAIDRLRQKSYKTKKFTIMELEDIQIELELKLQELQ